MTSLGQYQMSWRFLPRLAPSRSITATKLSGYRRHHQLSRSRVCQDVRQRAERKAASCCGRQVTTSAPSIGPGPPYPLQDSADASSKSLGSKDGPTGHARSKWRETTFKVFETASTTFASIFVLGLAGYGYHLYYKDLVLRKMEIAFRPGDPVLDLAARPSSSEITTNPSNADWIRRTEQDLIDAIVSGREKGHYWLLIGEKGVGKSSMLLDAMQRVDGEGISMFEAHADLEIFRVRLGKALNYEFHEDYIGSLFSIKGPRDTTPLLDIERAFNKLEKIAMHRRRRVGRPLVLIINCTHLLRNDHDGQDLLELIQQRAEQWAAASLVTVVFNSDDYWVYDRLKQLDTRLEVLPISDLPRSQAIPALEQSRRRHFPTEPPPTPEALREVYSLVGGRLSFLSRVANAPDMRAECRRICERERTWFLNQCCILGAEMDDDVMNQQKYAAAAMVLAQALVNLEASAEYQSTLALSHQTPSSQHLPSSPSFSSSSSSFSSSSFSPDDIPLPALPLHVARHIMTRADFVQSYDHANLFTITSRAQVRADSVPMMHAFRAICGEPGFDAFLDATLTRIGDIESLGRTRELVAKDLLGGGRYRLVFGEGEVRVVVEEGD